MTSVAEHTAFAGTRATPLSTGDSAEKTRQSSALRRSRTISPERDTAVGIDGIRRAGKIHPTERDFLDKMTGKRTARNPEFPRLLDATRRRRELLRALATQRKEQRRSQTAVAAAMETSQSFVACLENTAADAKISTVDRYAESIGYVVQYHLIPAARADSAPSVVMHAP
jgi:hypothetical protein